MLLYPWRTDADVRQVVESEAAAAAAEGSVGKVDVVSCKQRRKGGASKEDKKRQAF